MTIVPANLRTEFPQDFTSDSDDALQRAIDRAYRQVGDAWGDLADDGALYLAAHLRTVAKRGGSGVAGPVQSKKVGDVSVTYAVPLKPLGGTLEATGYGQEFLRMLYLLPDARFAVDPSDNFFDGVPAPGIDGGADGV